MQIILRVCISECCEQLNCITIKVYNNILIPCDGYVIFKLLLHTTRIQDFDVVFYCNICLKVIVRFLDYYSLLKKPAILHPTLMVYYHGRNRKCALYHFVMGVAGCDACLFIYIFYAKFDNANFITKHVIK